MRTPLPEARLIKKEVVFRILYPDEEVRLSKKSAIRFIALSLGLISPNESRRGFLDVFELIFERHLKGEGITAGEIARELSLDDKTVYYHLKKLFKAGLLTKKENNYFLGDLFEKNFVRVVKRLYEKDLEEMISSLEKVYKAISKNESY